MWEDLRWLGLPDARGKRILYFLLWSRKIFVFYFFYSIFIFYFSFEQPSFVEKKHRVLCVPCTCRHGVDPFHQLWAVGHLSVGLQTTFLLPGGEQAAGESKKTCWEKRLTFTLYQTPENPMVPMFHYFHCSQDNLFSICFFCNAWRPTNSGLLFTRQRTNRDPIPKEFPAHGTAASSTPHDILGPLLSLGCCLCFQQGLGFHPLWPQKVTVLLLTNTTAFWGRAMGWYYWKTIKSCQEKSRTVNALLSRADYISNRSNKNMKMERTLKSRGESDRLFSFTFTPPSLAFLSSPVLSVSILSSINHLLLFSRFVLFSPQNTCWLSTSTSLWCHLLSLTCWKLNCYPSTSFRLFKAALGIRAWNLLLFSSLISGKCL